MCNELPRKWRILRIPQSCHRDESQPRFPLSHGMQETEDKAQDYSGTGFYEETPRKSPSSQGYTLRVRWTGNKCLFSPQERKADHLPWPSAQNGQTNKTSPGEFTTSWGGPKTPWDQFSSVQSSVMSDSLRPRGLQHARPPCPSPTPRAYSNSCPLSRWCHPAISSSVVPFSSCLIFSSIRVFSNEAVLPIRWPKYWSFSFNINPSNEHPGLISFRMDWLDLLAVQGTLKSLLQHHSSKTSILLCSAFFIVQLSHPYMTTRKTID